jgi:hypothetical protein
MPRACNPLLVTRSDVGSVRTSGCVGETYEHQERQERQSLGKPCQALAAVNLRCARSHVCDLDLMNAHDDYTI